MASVHHFVLSVVFLREGDGWVAQALEHDLTAQGTSLEAAKTAFERTVIGQLILDQKMGRPPLEHLPPAPEHYWQAFSRAAIKTLGEPVSVPPGHSGPPAYVIEAIAA